jgi:hypothetical protein
MILDYLSANRWRVALATILLVVGLILLVDHLVVTEEERIEEVLLEARDRWLAQDEAGFVALLTEDFTGDPFQPSRRDIGRLMRTYAALDISLSCRAFELAGDRCTLRVVTYVHFTDRALSGRSSDRIPFAVEMRRTGETWRIARADYSPGLR